MLTANSQLLDQGFVSFGVVRFQIGQQPASFAHQHQQPTPGSMIALMRLEMFRQLLDALTQKGDLHFRRTGILGMGMILGDDTLLCFFRQWHSLVPYSFSASISLYYSLSIAQPLAASRPGSRVLRNLR